MNLCLQLCYFVFLCYHQVEIKRTIPKGAAQLEDFKTKKIFVGGIPSNVSEGIPFFRRESVHIDFVYLYVFFHINTN